MKNMTALRELWTKVPVGIWDEAVERTVDYSPCLELDRGESYVLSKLITDEEADKITEEMVMEAYTQVRSKISSTVILLH